VAAARSSSKFIEKEGKDPFFYREEKEGWSAFGALGGEGGSSSIAREKKKRGLRHITPKRNDDNY